MASEKQIAASRANAKRSTGPKTAAGRLKSSRNAYRHGLLCPARWLRIGTDIVGGGVNANIQPRLFPLG
jgi:hypothetical protein